MHIPINCEVRLMDFAAILKLKGSFKYNTLYNNYVSIGLYFSKETKSNNNEEKVIRHEDWTEAKPRSPFIGYMKKHS